MLGQCGGCACACRRHHAKSEECGVAVSTMHTLYSIPCSEREQRARTEERKERGAYTAILNAIHRNFHF